jgi:hypothetical protein
MQSVPTPGVSCVMHARKDRRAAQCVLSVIAITLVLFARLHRLIRQPLPGC